MSADEKVHYFSNGTEGAIWMDEWCNRCTHDHGTHRDEWDAEDGCPHILNTMVEAYDPVFIPTEELVERRDGTTFMWSSWSCVEFSRCRCDRGPDDPGVEPPLPIDPNQGVLFEADALMPGVWRDVVLDELTTEFHMNMIGGVALYPGVEPGHALGSLSAAEAERFAKHVDAYLTGPGGDAA